VNLNQEERLDRRRTAPVEYDWGNPESSWVQTAECVDGKTAREGSRDRRLLCQSGGRKSGFRRARRFVANFHRHESQTGFGRFFARRRVTKHTFQEIAQHLQRGDALPKYFVPIAPAITGGERFNQGYLRMEVQLCSHIRQNVVHRINVYVIRGKLPFC